MALGGWLPAAYRGVLLLPDGFSRKNKERGCNLAPKLVPNLYCNEIDWVL